MLTCIDRCLVALAVFAAGCATEPEPAERFLVSDLLRDPGALVAAREVRPGSREEEMQDLAATIGECVGENAAGRTGTSIRVDGETLVVDAGWAELDRVRAVLADMRRFSATSRVIEALAGLRTEAEMRACLRDGRTDAELGYVGFDQVSVAECIEQVVAAVREDRARPGSQETYRRLTRAVDLCVAATREAAIRRSAGAAPCLPPVR